jgi:HrpA-like RNA helicase
LGLDLSSIFRRLGAQTSHVTPPALKKDKAPEELPVSRHKAEIIRLARESRDVVLEAETGSGKTTIVPGLINDQGPKVIVVVPRRLPASEVAAFGAQVRNEEVGESIGFAHSLEKKISDKSGVILATAGWELARQLNEPLLDDTKLVVDEFHERTAASVLLLGFYKMRKAQGHRVPCIWVMSATINKERIVPYLDNPAVITVEGRRFSITELKKGPSPSADAVRFLKQAINPLSFHYGVKDIEQHIVAVRKDAPTGSTVYPLHSKMGREAQKAAIEERPFKAVAATNTAQTSITIKGMGAVIITGDVRRLVLDKEGVPSLIIDSITQDEYRQQMGRVGRTQNGFVVNHGKPYDELRPHAPSEIQNMPLETMILKLAAAKISFYEINRYLIDQAPKTHIDRGYEVLRNLGLIESPKEVNSLGKKVSKLPVDVRMGKLLVKAEEYQQQHKVEILDDAVRIAAVVEAEGILSGESRQWQRIGSNERGSDLIKQALVFQRAHNMSPEKRAELGIDEVNYQRACDIERLLRRRLRLSEEAPRRIPEKQNETMAEMTHRQSREETKRKWLSRAIIEAHVDCVFRLIGRNQAGDYLYKPLQGKNTAVLQKESVVGGAKLVVGTRFNIGYLDDSGTQRILALLLNAHRVDEDLEWLDLSTPSNLRGTYKDEISQAHRQPRRKEKGMRSRDFRGGRNGKHGFGKGHG